jgi:hypothetical protein
MTKGFQEINIVDNLEKVKIKGPFAQYVKEMKYLKNFSPHTPIPSFSYFLAKSAKISFFFR